MYSQRITVLQLPSEAVKHSTDLPFLPTDRILSGGEYDLDVLPNKGDGFIKNQM